MPMPAARSESTAAMASVRILRMAGLWTLPGFAPGRAGPRLSAPQLNAADVTPVTRVDAQRVAGVDEQGNLHGCARFELGRLGRAGRSVALESGVRLRDPQLDVSRDVHADGVALVELHVDLRAVFEKIGRLSDQVALDRDVLVRLRIHEMVAFGVVIEHLHLAVVNRRAFELLTRAEGAFDRRSRANVLEPGAHERRALAGLYVQELDDGP